MKERYFDFLDVFVRKKDNYEFLLILFLITELQGIQS